MMKKFITIAVLSLSLISSVKAIEEQELVTSPIESNNGNSLKAAEEAPALTNPNLRLIDIKNEFHESVKLVLESKNANAEIKYKEIYLKPYQGLTDITISKNTDYKLELYNLYNKYIGYLINVDTKNAKLINVSPFYLATEQNKKLLPIILAPENTKKEEIKEEKSPAKPVEVPTVNGTNKEEKYIKVSNLTNEAYKLEVQTSDGEVISKIWDIDTDTYSPEFLDLDSKHLKVKANYKLKLTSKKTDKNLTKTVKDLSLDEQGNYIWLINTKPE